MALGSRQCSHNILSNTKYDIMKLPTCVHLSTRFCGSRSGPDAVLRVKVRKTMVSLQAQAGVGGLLLFGFSVCTFLLQSHLHGVLQENGEPWFGARGRHIGHKNDPIQDELARALQLQTLAEEELAVVQKTLSLADEVGRLAKKLEGRKERWAIKARADGFAIDKALASHAPPLASIRDSRKRQELVVDAMRHSWRQYEQYAWGQDELMPLSRTGKNSFGGLGATIVDALDTLWLMGLKDEFGRARDWVAHNLTFDRYHEASVFETTIRIVGGLLSAHELSGDKMLLDKAQELEDRLLHAYNTPTGIPFNLIHLSTLKARNPSWTLRSSTLSEYGTQQLEMLTLANKTGAAVYREKTEAPIKYLNEHYPDKGLLPLYINPTTGKFTTKRMSLGAEGDSYYEYLLKVWIIKGKTDDMYRDMWVRSMDDAIAQLGSWHVPSSLSYFAEFDRVRIRHKMDHLACFLPAMLALGAHEGAVQGARREQYMTLAKNLTRTCWEMYNQMATGLAPEFVEFPEHEPMRAGVRAKHNLLRPEALEAMYILWRTTGESRYREWGWQMFVAFLRWCKVEGGFAGLKDVTRVPPENDDTMQSFWLAETLKYAYLLFGGTDVLPLSDWVLNTEAHPLRIMHGGLPNLLPPAGPSLSPVESA